MIKLLDVIKVHFIGIGGVSMSKLAALLNRWGYIVSGSDSAESKTLARLRSIGVYAYCGEDAAQSAAADLVVYSSAIRESNAERVSARYAIERMELLRLIEQRFDTSIAVSGAHGKTTMCGMLAWVIGGLGISNHAHVGGEVLGLDPLGMNNYCNAANSELIADGALDVATNTQYNASNSLSIARNKTNNLLDSADNVPMHSIGSGDTLVIEACEYKRSFLSLSPHYSVILNVDYDHPDCYSDIEDVYGAFAEFMIATSQCCFVEYQYCSKVTRLARQRRETYGKIANNDMQKGGNATNTDVDNKKVLPTIVTFGDDISADYCIVDATMTRGGATADIYKSGKYYGKLELRLHNTVNLKAAIAVVAVLDTLGFSAIQILPLLREFRGVARRFELLGKTPNGCDIYTDYAHHPEEITAMLSCYNKLIKVEMIDNRSFCNQVTTPISSSKSSQDICNDTDKSDADCIGKMPLAERDITTEKARKGRRVLVFEPHTYSRTKALLSQFVKSLSMADICYILPTYPARECPSQGATAYELYDMLCASGYENCHYCCNNEELAEKLSAYGQCDDIMLCGAGIDYEKIYLLIK